MSDVDAQREYRERERCCCKLDGKCELVTFIRGSYLYLDCDYLYCDTVKQLSLVGYLVCGL